VSTPDSALLSRLRHHLDGLKRTPDGQVLYTLIERAMKRYGGDDGHIEQAFAGFLHALLARCANDPKYSAVTRVKARLIQQRLALYLPARPATPPDEEISGAEEVVAPVAEEREPPPQPTAAVGVPPRPETTTPAPAVTPVVEVEHLASGVASSLAGSAEIKSLLAGEQQSMHRLDSAIGDLNDLKQLLVKGLDDLIRERQQLQSRLNAAAEYMKEVEQEQARLRTELEHARRGSQADAVTGLPLREIFVRALEAEVGRVKRYGFSLVLALLNIDGLREIGERQGQAGRDAVLRCYAHEVLTIFRSYDLVARYDDDGFAILYPNTQRDGAMRALEKAQKRASETILNISGHTVPLPGFSSVLAIYAQGEKPAALLKRAAEALAHARLKGGGRTVVSLPVS
jgi:diguanylate cyclase (GGDEF)-like protein